MAIDLNGIKTQLKSILDTANTTTATYDLSEGMDKRVQKVLKVNPLKIPIQPSFFPYITCYTDNKEIELDTIAKNQLTGRRQADISLQVIGAVWDSIISDPLLDDADEECERLMENIEEIIRRDFTLNDTVKWSKPESISFHSLPLDEQTSMRVGALTLNCKVFY